jgi:6-phosphogluconolactonase
MEPQVPRISLTLPALNAARRVVFLVTGADKAKAMKRAFGDPSDPSSPAAHVRPRAGELLVLCDPAAAKELG